MIDTWWEWQTLSIYQLSRKEHAIPRPNIAMNKLRKILKLHYVDQLVNGHENSPLAAMKIPHGRQRNSPVWLGQLDGGHDKFPIGGHENSPDMANKSPQIWPRNSPGIPHLDFSLGFDENWQQFKIKLTKGGNYMLQRSTEHILVIWV